MAKAKSQEMLRKQKEGKQKKLLFLMIPVLLIAVVFNVMKFMGGGEETPAASSSATDTSAADTSATPTDAAAGGGTAVAGVAVQATLIDSDVPPEASEGQLVSFERFIAVNPFNQQVSEGEAAPSDEAPAASSGESAPSSGGSSGGDTSGDSDKPNAANLTVNGASETVLVGDSFPASDPTFKLVAVKDTTAKIGLVTGSFSTGADTIDLKVGQTLTLVSQPDGIRYVIKLVGIEHSSSSDSGDSTDGVDTGTAGTVPTDSTTVDTSGVPSTTGADSGTSGVSGDASGVAGYLGG